MPVTVQQLSDFEAQFDGAHRRIRRREVSPLDPRLADHGTARGIPGKMISGWRFRPNRKYVEMYAKHLAPLSGRRFVMVELGVLRGVGLAVWCEAFPEARVIGLDIDPGLYDKRGLVARGAFRKSKPEVYRFDELSPDCGARLRAILKGERIDVMIDDALHDDASILAAMDAILPLMADRFIYFVEDNNTADIAGRFPQFNVSRVGKITMVSNYAS